jgi:hypothetical protein
MSAKLGVSVQQENISLHCLRAAFRRQSQRVTAGWENVMQAVLWPAHIVSVITAIEPFKEKG